MKRIHFTLPAFFLVVALFAVSQEEQPVEKTLPQLIGEIAEKDNRQASDYQQIAQSTLHLGQQAKQSGQMLPEPVIYDALDAVEAGRALQPEASIWDMLQSGLEELLKPNEQQQQQEQEQDEKQKKEDSEQQQGSESDSQSPEQSEDGQKQDGENPQNQENPSEDKENQKPSESQGEQDGEGQQGAGEQPKNQPRSDSAQLGDLNESEQQKPPELSKPSAAEPPAEQMQTLGGTNENEQPVNAQSAELMQMLEQLKQQDDPAKLFQLLQEAQTGEKKKQQPNGKDW